MSKLKFYLTILVGYFIGRHYGRQQGQITRRSVGYQFSSRSVNQSINSYLTDLILRRINKWVYGDEAYRPRRYAHDRVRYMSDYRYPSIETENELEDLEPVTV